jgi:hypothetical protein
MSSGAKKGAIENVPNTGERTSPNIQLGLSRGPPADWKTAHDIQTQFTQNRNERGSASAALTHHVDPKRLKRHDKATVATEVSTNATDHRDLA